MHTYIIAEAGVNHNGQLGLALKLCDAAKKAGVDCVKFQTWQTEKIVTRKVEKATYQLENIPDAEESQFDMLKKLELSYENFRIVQDHCKKIGIDFLSTPDEEYSLAFLMNELNLPLIKIGSGEVTNIPYLRQIASYGKPIILSTGMATLAQVAIAYDTLLIAGAPSVALLHCTTNYPCPKNEVNLRAMQTMKESFKCQVGYSDHTMGTEIPIAAVVMGAEIIEKHFTLDRNIEVALGDGIKRPNPSEVEISKVVLKSIVAKVPVKKGDVLTANNITIKRAGRGIPAAHWDMVVGTKALHDFDIDDPIKID